MRVICIGDIRYNEGQLLDVHEQAPEVLSAIREHPEVTRIYSHEATAAEGAGLRS
jgi:hypothetical protein